MIRRRKLQLAGRQTPDLRQAVLRGLGRMRNGKTGYRDLYPGDLLNAIEDAPFGVEPPLPVVREGLSEREIQVIDAVSHGMTNPMIAEHLGLSLETVKTHAMHVQAKLKSKNRAHAACAAIRAGIIN